MSSFFTKFVLASTLLVAQVLGSVAVPAFGQCSEESCCCSLDAKESGTCCCQGRRSTDRAKTNDCCHFTNTRTGSQAESCGCGCHSESHPTTPSQRSKELRDEVRRTAPESADLNDLSLHAVNTRPTARSGRQRNAFYSGISQQSLYCAWLL